MPFVHLRAHTQYSLLSSTNKIDNYIKKIKELGINSAVITDFGNMYGVIDFYKEAKSQGIKPILGCEVYLADNKDCLKKEGGTNQLVLLAENNEGYKNLIRIVSIGFVHGFYKVPRVDYRVLRKYSKGIIAISTGLNSPVSTYLLENDTEEASKEVKALLEIFGGDNFFLGLEFHGFSQENKINQGIMALAKEYNISLVATNNILYTNQRDYIGIELSACIMDDKCLDISEVERKPHFNYIRSEDEMRQVFPYAVYAVDNTQKIADRCNVEIKFHEPKLPKFELENSDSFEFLRNLCVTGLNKRYDKTYDYDELSKRLDYELSVIKDMGFIDYFLIVWDFIKYAKDNDIAVGPGRGSAAGSIVAYCLGITDVDPIKYGLVFERFLNPQRVSMPDIDVDFCYERRSEVIDYVIEKYGQERVLQIITFGTLGARGAINDVGKALSVPQGKIRKLSSQMPVTKVGQDTSIAYAIANDAKLLQLVNDDEDYKKIIEYAKSIEGMPRHTSTHAAGVVICGEDAMNLIPIATGTDNVLTTQFTMNTIEELGLLKMDFLGLRTLSVIQKAAKMANVEISSLDRQDSKVYKMISAGNTVGMFQLESRGMQSFMKKLKPGCFDDIIAGISLFRPGPMDFIDQYIRGKQNPDSIHYHCEQLKEILSATYGCIVYQEQVMQIVQKLAGYSLGRSDILRRAMSKKKGDVMQKEREIFVYGDARKGITGCVNNGISEKIANQIYDEMVDFAKYAFNKSHAVAYAILSYRTAYLKCFHPAEFMSALLTSVSNDKLKITEYINDCRYNKIDVLAPNINISRNEFVVYEGKIVFGLEAIRGIGTDTANKIVEQRDNNGMYISLYDLVIRNKELQQRKSVLESLIKSGALDQIEEYGRNAMILSYPELIRMLNNDKNKYVIPGQSSIFENSTLNPYGFKVIPYEEFSQREFYNYEKEVIYICLSGHPMNAYDKILHDIVNAKAIDFVVNEDDEAMIQNNKRVTVAGIISKVKKIVDSKGRAMAFVELEDSTGTLEAVVFADAMQKYDNLIYEDTPVVIVGDYQHRIGESEAKLITRFVYLIEDLPKKVYINLKDIDTYYENEEFLLDLAKDRHGDDDLIAVFKSSKQMKIVARNFRIVQNDDVYNMLTSRFGAANVAILYKKLANSK